MEGVIRFAESVDPSPPPPPPPVNDDNYYIYESDDSDDDEGEMPPTPPPNPALVQVVQQINNAAPSADGFSECVVCLERQPSVIFLGCYHICVCWICIKGIHAAAEGDVTKCPYCRAASGFIIGKLPAH